MAEYCDIDLEFIEPRGSYDVGDRVAVKATFRDSEGNAIDLSSTTVEGRYQTEGITTEFSLTTSGNEATGSFLTTKAGTYHVRVQAGGAYEGAEEDNIYVHPTTIDGWEITTVLLAESDGSLLTESGDKLLAE